MHIEDTLLWTAALLQNYSREDGDMYSYHSDIVLQLSESLREARDSGFSGAYVSVWENSKEIPDIDEWRADQNRDMFASLKERKWTSLGRRG